MQTNFKKRILFIGMPDMGLVCLAKAVAERVNIVACVPPDKNNGTYKLFCDFAKKLDMNIIPYENSLSDEDFIKKITDLELDLAVVCSYGKLFPEVFLNTTKDGFVNVHPSLLPRYRGGNPYSHVIINGEKETGVTLHYMDNSFDTGDIIMQKKFAIRDSETMGTLFNRLNYLSADMLIEFLTKYEKGDSIERIKQPNGFFVKAPVIKELSPETMIDWNKPAVYSERLVRALNPFIHAVCSYRGNYLKIHTATVENRDSGFPAGTIVSTDETLAVACKKGILHIKVLQAGSYFIGEAKQFIRLSRCKVGERMD